MGRGKLIENFRLLVEDWELGYNPTLFIPQDQLFSRSGFLPDGLFSLPGPSPRDGVLGTASSGPDHPPCVGTQPVSHNMLARYPQQCPVQVYHT